MQFKKYKKILTTSHFTFEEAKSVDNKKESYYRIIGKPSVICCILNCNDEFVFVKQFRQSLEMATIEMPAGSIEHMESPLQAAKREILEEAGLICDLIRVGNKYSLMMNRTNIKDYLFFGMNPKFIDYIQSEEETEVICIKRKIFLEDIFNGQFLQLGAIGLLFLIEGILKVSLWNSDYLSIEKAFKNYLAQNNGE